MGRGWSGLLTLACQSPRLGQRPCAAACARPVLLNGVLFLHPHLSPTPWPGSQKRVGIVLDLRPSPPTEKKLFPPPRKLWVLPASPTGAQGTPWASCPWTWGQVLDVAMDPTFPLTCERHEERTKDAHCGPSPLSSSRLREGLGNEAQVPPPPFRPPPPPPTVPGE